MTIAVDLACRGCPQALKRAQRLGGWHKCTLCGQEYIAPKEPSPLSLDRAVAITGSDLNLLAQWSARIYGRAISLEPSHHATGDRSRPEDDRGSAFARAMTVHRRLEVLRSNGILGKLHAEVLWFVYLERTGGTATGLGDLFGEVGLRFGSVEQRAVWRRKRKSVASEAPRKWGKKTHDDACVNYASRKQVT